MMEDTDTATVTLEGEPFDPKTVDIDHKNIRLDAMRTWVDDQFVTQLVVNHAYDYSMVHDHEDNKRPSWMDLPQEERVWMELPQQLANVITRQILGKPNGFIYELPCPPYEYGMEEGKLVISAGAFQKAGSKAEWQAVIKEMQQQVEDMPDGIDVTDLPDITINVTIRSSTTVEVSVDDLLEGHEQYDGELFNGDKYDLESALDEALDNYEVDEYNVSMVDVYVDELEVESNDLSYCIQQVTDG